MNFSAEKLKYMAADVVSQYLMHKTPLSQVVAEVASSSSLNPEQIKRLVEISNQVAYLKLLETATDRTFEFPLAEYEEVMAILARPDENMSKEASQKPSPMDIASGVLEENLEKVASEDSERSFLDNISQQEKIAMLNKEMYRAKGELEKVACEEQVIFRDLTSRVHGFQDDPVFMEKVAMVADGDETLITKIARLVFGEDKEYSGDELFYESDVEDAREYVELFKQAEELITYRKELEDRINRAESYLKKEAFAPVANVAKKVKDVFNKVSDKGADVGNKAINRIEQTTYLSDQMLKQERDVWKSLRGK